MIYIRWKISLFTKNSFFFAVFELHFSNAVTKFTIISHSTCPFFSFTDDASLVFSVQIRFSEKTFFLFVKFRNEKPESWDRGRKTKEFRVFSCFLSIVLTFCQNMLLFLPFAVRNDAKKKSVSCLSSFSYFFDVKKKKRIESSLISDLVSAIV